MDFYVWSISESVQKTYITNRVPMKFYKENTMDSVVRVDADPL